MKPPYQFYRQKEQIEEVVKATHDSLKDWQQDPLGYFLIRVNHEKKVIEVGFATNDHIIRKKIIGQNAAEIYNTIIKRRLVSRLEHAAYLGKELYKAELALKYGKTYHQESPLLLQQAVRLKLKKES